MTCRGPAMNWSSAATFDIASTPEHARGSHPPWWPGPLWYRPVTSEGKFDPPFSTHISMPLLLRDLDSETQLYCSHLRAVKVTTRHIWRCPILFTALHIGVQCSYLSVLRTFFYTQEKHSTTPKCVSLRKHTTQIISLALHCTPVTLTTTLRNSGQLRLFPRTRVTVPNLGNFTQIHPTLIRNWENWISAWHILSSLFWYICC